MDCRFSLTSPNEVENFGEGTLSMPRTRTQLDKELQLPDLEPPEEEETEKFKFVLSNLVLCSF